MLNYHRCTAVYDYQGLRGGIDLPNLGRLFLVSDLRIVFRTDQSARGASGLHGRSPLWLALWALFAVAVRASFCAARIVAGGTAAMQHIGRIVAPC